MFKSILVPIDLADTDLAKPAIATAATLSQTWNGSVRLLNVLPTTPTMLAEYVPADFDAQQRATSEEALTIVATESGIEASRISTAVRQGSRSSTPATRAACGPCFASSRSTPEVESTG